MPVKMIINVNSTGRHGQGPGSSYRNVVIFSRIVEEPEKEKNVWHTLLKIIKSTEVIKMLVKLGFEYLIKPHFKFGFSLTRLFFWKFTSHPIRPIRGYKFGCGSIRDENENALWVYWTYKSFWMCWKFTLSKLLSKLGFLFMDYDS